MENKQSDPEDVSSAKAVLLGALAPGVNGPTWNTLKVAFLMLGLCLAAMLGLAFSSSDTGMILHVTLLVLITGTLFILLTRAWSFQVGIQRRNTWDDRWSINSMLRSYCSVVFDHRFRFGLIDQCFPTMDNIEPNVSRVNLTRGACCFPSRFLAEIGLVSVEHQMQEMGLAPKDSAVIDKKSS
ncbi:hypothetical protein RHGRI_004666 [Rhododendron griersonianum]|uniref:Uncharacterized protein n=1 Tax=Rhododendron griersonianum TaxID=479676 RepID=A0AAV6LBA5_9ERIC|nr:hypothetical protein RHGRI_004666 [Rhododendron griersonianum]